MPRFEVWTKGKLPGTNNPYSEYRGLADGKDFETALEKFMDKNFYREYEYDKETNTLYGDTVFSKRPIYEQLAKLGI